MSYGRLVTSCRLSLRQTSAIVPTNIRYLRAASSTVKPLFSTPRRSFCAALDKDKLKELRNLSGAPLKDCKKALAQSDGNIEDAIDFLRIEGVATARKKADQEALNGFVAALVSNIDTDGSNSSSNNSSNSSSDRFGSIAEVNCVTDFVENNPLFQTAVANIANTVMLSDALECNEMQNIAEISDKVTIIRFDAAAASDPSTRQNQTLNEALTDIVSAIRENLVLRRAYRMKVSDKGVIGSYVHSRKTANLGMKGGLVGLETDSSSALLPGSEEYEAVKELANNIALHCVCNIPRAVNIARQDLDPMVIEREKKVLLEQALQEAGDSTNLEIAQKKVEGRMKKFYADSVLLDQPYCLEDDSKFTVAKLIDQTGKKLGGMKIRVTNMAVFSLGEKLDDAAEKNESK